MKLKYEQFEGIGSFTVRGRIEASQFRLLAIGLESLVKNTPSPLVVNLTRAPFDEAYNKNLIELKKTIQKLTRQKVYWIGKVRGLCDYPEIGLLFSRLGGFKLRQVGDRLKLEDELFGLHEQIEVAKKKIDELGGDEDNAHRLILENKILREKLRILSQTVRTQEERMKVQQITSTTDPDHTEKLKTAREAIKTGFGDIPL
jgi:regulator of replication initiation timing